MSEEIKENVVNEETPVEPKIIMTYVVHRYDNGLYDFDCTPVEGGVQSMEKSQIAQDIVDLGRRLDNQMILEEATERAVNIVFTRLAQMAAQKEAAAEPADPTQA